MLPPRLSLVPNPHKDQSAIVSLEMAGDQEYPTPDSPRRTGAS